MATPPPGFRYIDVHTHLQIKVIVAHMGQWETRRHLETLLAL